MVEHRLDRSVWTGRGGAGRGKPRGIARQCCDWLSGVITGRGEPDLLGWLRVQQGRGEYSGDGDMGGHD
jgi:hypothetical protein